MKSTKRIVREFLEDYPDMPRSKEIYVRRLRSIIKRVRQETISALDDIEEE